MKFRPIIDQTGIEKSCRVLKPLSMNVFTIHDKLEISGFRNYWKSTENSDVIPQDDHALFTSIPIKKNFGLYHTLNLY